MYRRIHNIVTNVVAAAFGLALASITRLEAQQPDTSAVHLATEASQVWLKLVDDGKYDESWDTAAPSFQQAVTKPAWSQALAQARGPFEPFGERTLLGARYFETLPNAPPGPYVVIQYRTKVSGNREVIETVVPMRAGQALWRVSGYFVKPAP